MLFSSGASITSSSGAASNVNATTGSPTAQTSVTINTLQIGTVTVTFANNSQILQTNGILDQGGTPVIGGAFGGATTGNIEAATAGGELVVRVASGAMVINSSILDNGGSALTLSGGGATTLAIQGTNSYAGVTTVEPARSTSATAPPRATWATARESSSTPAAASHSTARPMSALPPIPSPSAPFASGVLIVQAGTGTLTLGNVNNSGNSNTSILRRIPEPAR